MVSNSRTRVLRVIARMNIGGPAYHVSLLSGKLDPARYETLLVTGDIGPGEASFAELADRYGATLMKIPALGPEIRPSADAHAMKDLARVIRDFNPHIVHTHTAKAGALGRVTAFLAQRPRPVLVHTYHGHVLEDFFGPVASGFYRGIETLLGRFTDCLVCVSAAVADDLIRLKVAPSQKFRVIPLGLDLERFLNLEEGRRQRFRRSLDAEDDEVLCLFSGRLVPTKRVDFILRALGKVGAAAPKIRVVIVGDGPERQRLEDLSRTLGVDGNVLFLGYRKDIEDVVAGCDLALLASRSEGTPLFLIEASAAGRPTVATAVDGVPDIVTHASGILVDMADLDEFADGIVRLASDQSLRAEMGSHAREHVSGRFSSTRLLTDIDELYVDLLTRRTSSLDRSKATASRRGSTG